MHQKDSRLGFPPDGRLQQVQEHVSETAVQAAGEGQHRAEKVQPRQQEGPGPVHLVLRAEREADEQEGRAVSATCSRTC